MLKVVQAQKPEYYLKPDCPMEGQKIEVRVGGKDAERLDLTDKPFGELSFLRLAKGLNPESGSKLTARLKENRQDAKDVCLTVPKEISMMIEVARDGRVKAALWDANDYAMRRWEKGAKVRERKGRVYKDRDTGSMIWFSFYHGTTRPIGMHADENTARFQDQDGNLHVRRAANENRKPMPDPHAHIHNYVPNVSYDRTEKIWKALKRHHFDVTKIEYDMHKRLAGNLRKLGHQATVEAKYETRRRKVLGVYIPKRVLVSSTIKVKGFDPETVALFSRRQGEIKDVERQRPYLNAEGNATYRKKMEKAKAQLSQVVRQSKDDAEGLTREEVHADWVSRMTPDQYRGVMNEGSRAKSSVKSAIRSRWHKRSAASLDRLRESAIQEQSHERGVERSR